MTMTGARHVRVAAVAVSLVVLLCIVVSALVDRLVVARLVAPDVEAVTSILLERSVPSFVGHGFAVAAAALLAVGHHRSGSPAMAAWTVVMLVAALDDALELHETLGREAVAWLGLTRLGPLKAQDIGELLAWAVMGLAVLPALVSALTATLPLDRRVHGVFFPLFALLLVCGVVFDMAHSALGNGLGKVFGYLEDGGELAVLGAMAVAALALLPAVPDGRREA